MSFPGFFATTAEIDGRPVRIFTHVKGRIPQPYIHEDGESSWWGYITGILKPEDNDDPHTLWLVITNQATNQAVRTKLYGPKIPGMASFFRIGDPIHAKGRFINGVLHCTSVKMEDGTYAVGRQIDRTV